MTPRDFCGKIGCCLGKAWWGFGVWRMIWGVWRRASLSQGFEASFHFHCILQEFFDISEFSQQGIRLENEAKTFWEVTAVSTELPTPFDSDPLQLVAKLTRDHLAWPFHWWNSHNLQN
jgi:hypothetical protein